MRCLLFFFLMVRRPPRSTLFPYTTLFRSLIDSYAFVANSRQPFFGLLAWELVTGAVGRCEFVRLPLSEDGELDRKSTRLNSSHGYISYAVFCLKKKKHNAFNSTSSVLSKT